MTPAWVLILVALIALSGVLSTAVITNWVNTRSNRAIQARWEADRRALEARWQADREASEVRWHTELLASEGRAARAEEVDERQDRRAKALAIYESASTRVVSSDPKVAQLGADALKALLTSTLVDDDLKPLVVAALGSSYASEIKAIEAIADSGDQVVVLQLDLEADEAGDVPLIQGGEDDRSSDQAEEGSDD